MGTAGLVGRDRRHSQFVIADGLGDGVGGGVGGDLELLVPELRLLRLDLVMQRVGLVGDLSPFLPQLQHDDCDSERCEGAEK